MPPHRLCRSLVVFALALATPPTAVAEAQLPADSAARVLDQVIRRGMADWGLPGLAIAVVRRDTVLFARGYGVRQLGATAQVGPDTPFGIMSTTKAFTALAIAMLVDSGRVRWSDPVTQHLPEFALFDPAVTRDATVRDLLTHSLGVPNADLLWTRGDLPADEILHRVRALPPAYVAGRAFVYQNVMYGAAGALVARVSGRPWEAFVQARILAPLGMARSWPTHGAMAAVAGAEASRAHVRLADTTRTIDEETVDALPAAGAIWSTATDMARWLRFLLDSGRVNGRRLVSEPQFRELFRPAVLVPPAEFYPTTRLTRPRWTTYGLGWFQQDFRGRALHYHTGSLDGRTAMVGLLPEAGTGVFIAGNLDHAELRHALLFTVMDLYAGTNGGAARDWHGEVLALYRGLEAQAAAQRAAVERQRAPGTRPSLPLAAYAGRYTHPVWGDATVTVDGDALTVRLGTSPQARGRIAHWHHDTFRGALGDGRGGATTFLFQLDQAGRVARVLMEGSERYAFVRVGGP